MKKYDIFTFFNELDLLEIRLNILDKHVDYFVIVEATETFSGLPKPLYFEENKERFRRWQHKIIHYVVTDTPKDENDTNCDTDILQIAKNSSNVPKGIVHWLKEFYQKENIKKALIGLQDDDLCFIGDVDEIWNPEIVISNENKIFKLKQLVYVYSLNNRSSEPWAGTLVTTYSNIKNACLNHLRTASKTSYIYVENGGWHFTNIGDVDFIQKKLEASYSATDFNTDAIKSNIKKRLLKNKDYIGRDFKFWIDESDLPKYILDNREKYATYFKEKPEVKKGLIVSQLTGGLGNQLFQYAAGKALAERNGADFALDISSYKKVWRPFVLDEFNITAKKANRWDIFRAKYFPFGKKFVEPHFHFFPKFFDIKGNAYIEGLFQSEKYFKNIKEDIRKEFTPRIPIAEKFPDIAQRITYSEAVAVAIRRGDYLTKPHLYNILTPEYYKKTIRLMSERVHNPVFFFFSDDIEWVKENIPCPDNSVFVSDGKMTGPEEFVLMTLCKHNIIANSTFSWWAAWLNKNPEKIIIAPKKWFTDVLKDTRDVLPDGWIKI